MATKLNYGPAKKFLYTCQYLKGKEVNIKRRNGSTTTGTVIGFGAHGTIWTKIVLWAIVKDTNSNRKYQVHLMQLYRMHPLVERQLSKKELKAQQKAQALEEMASSETTAS